VESVQVLQIFYFIVKVMIDISVREMQGD